MVAYQGHLRDQMMHGLVKGVHMVGVLHTDFQFDDLSNWVLANDHNVSFRVDRRTRRHPEVEVMARHKGGCQDSLHGAIRRGPEPKLLRVVEYVLLRASDIFYVRSVLRH